MMLKLRAPGRLRLVVSLVAALLLAGSIVGLALANTSNRSITSSVTVTAGGTATYTVTFDNTSNHYYRVTGTVTGNPTGVNVNASNCTHFSNGANGRQITFTITTTTSTPPNTYQVNATLAEYANYDNHCNGNYPSTWNLTSSLVVNKADTTTTLGSSVNPSTYGQSVTFTATVTSGATGSVTFKDGATTLGTTALSGTHATYTTSALSVGGHSITATYNGDTHYNTSTSAPLTQTVNKANPLFTFDALSDKTYGDAPFSVAAAAHKPGGDTGAITFALGAGSSGCTVTSGGDVTITGAGTCVIDASLAADANYNAAGPLTRSFTIGAADPAFSFDALSDKTYGDAPFSVAAAAHKPGDDTGAITFALGAGSSGCTVTSGGDVTITSIGTCVIDASLAADANYNAAGPLTRSFTINMADTTTTLVSSINPSTWGQSVTFTATVPAGATGYVRFYDDGSILGTSAISGTTATFDIDTLSVGSHPITATYLGDANYNSSTSSVLDQQVDKADPGLAFDLTTLPTKTYGDPDFSVAGYASAAIGDSSPITFALGGSSSGCTVDSAGNVSLTGAGTCVIEASIAADANYTAGGPVSQSFAVNPAGGNLTFDLAPMATPQYGDGSFSIAGYAGKPAGDTGAITFATTPDSVGCSVTPDGTVTITGIAEGGDVCKIEASLAGDDNFSADGPIASQFHIARAQLDVTADNQAVTAGDPVPAYSFHVAGFVAGEDDGSAAGYVAPTCASSYTTATAGPALLAITCSGGAADNYSFSYHSGTLAVSTAEATPTPTAEPTAEPTEQVGGETATPGQSATPPSTSTGSGSDSGNSTPLLALLICIAFGGLGLLVVQAQRRAIRG
jgi:hypothetical protein